MNDDFEKWVDLWAKAEEELANEKPVPKVEKKVSYFSGMPSDQDFVDPETNDGWNAIYKRAMEVDYNQDLITDAVNIAYAGNEGYGKQIPTGTPPKPGKTTYTQNPINFTSVGNDQENDSGKTRVTDNWSDGDELRELDEIKKQVEAMERKFHDADVTKKSDKGTIHTQLENLRERVKKLSEKIQSNPQTDLA